MNDDDDQLAEKFQVFGFDRIRIHETDSRVPANFVENR